MKNLWIKFDDRKILVNRDIFVVGRHSECDLSIADGRLSREHLKIERFGDVFAASDLNSSNGTLVNRTKLTKPTTLKTGDLLNLGGLEIETEISGNFSGNDSFGSFDDDFSDAPTQNEAEFEDAPDETAPALIKPNSPKPAVLSASKPNSTLKVFLILAPLCALLVVVLIVSSVIFFGKSKGETVKNENDFIYTKEKTEDTDDDNSNSGKKATPKPTAANEKSGGDNSSDSPVNSTSLSDDTNTQPTPKSQPDTAKVEQNSASFLRKIAQNDLKAFLTSEQAQTINQKIKQLGGSSDLADNIKSARSNAQAIQNLANSKNLKPQFVAVAALAKLGSSRGNVLQTAQGMADILDKLSIQLGSELADDSLLTVAVYDQGAAGDFLKTRNMLQDLSNKFPESSRTIRTIWFLHQKGKISDAEFDFAVRFLAIGTITQNPKDFGVNAEELKLN